MSSSHDQAPAPSWSLVWRQIRAGAAHPAGVTFLLIWMLAAVTLATRGHYRLVVQIALNLIPVLPVAAALLLWTAPNPPEGDAPRHSRPALWGQVIFLGAIILLTGLGAMHFHGVAPAGWEYIPLWTPLENALERAGGLLFGNDNWVRNPVLYMAIPGAVLLRWGVRPAELGMRRGYRSLAAAAPYLLVLGCLAIVKITRGEFRIVYLLPLAMLDNLLQNGLMEEFLFRGALQSRLGMLIGDGWSVIVSSLVFGAWHLGLTTGMLGGDYLAGLAMSIMSQATLGLLFGLIAMRTRSLIAPTVAHITVNLLG